MQPAGWAPRGSLKHHRASLGRRIVARRPYKGVEGLPLWWTLPKRWQSAGIVVSFRGETAWGASNIRRREPGWAPRARRGRLPLNSGQLS